MQLLDLAYWCAVPEAEVVMRYLVGFVFVVLAVAAFRIVGCGETPDIGEWGTAQRIDSDHEASAGAPSVAIDPRGNAIAIWVEAHGRDVVGYGIWANRFTAPEGWGPAERIDASEGADALGPDVAMDPDGNALAVWRLWNAEGDPSDTFWASRFIPSDGWQTEGRIENNDQGSSGNPRIAVDSQGNAIAVWPQWSETRENVWSNRFTPTNEWGSAQRIEANPNYDASNPQVAMNTHGNAIAVWATSITKQSSDFNEVHYYHIWSNRFTPTSGWGSPERIDEHEDNAINPDVAMDAQGNAIVVWEHNDGEGTRIWSNRFTPSSGWGQASRIDGGGWGWFPRVALDSEGRALAVWFHRSGMWSNRYTPTGGWGTPERISDELNTIDRPKLAMNSWGVAMVGWERWDGDRNNLWVRRFTPSNGWETPELVEAEEGTAYGPQLAIDQHGRAVAAWSQWDGERYNIWANAYR